MLMLDLFSGLGGASRAMKERGWEVITVEIDPKFNPSIVADVTTFHYEGRIPDLIWASPPCIEFSKLVFPWLKASAKPDTGLAIQTKRIIDEMEPRYWVVENVRGAIPYLSPIFGPVKKRTGSRFLWGEFPIFDCTPEYGKRYGWKSAAERALIPYQVSRALALAIEQTMKTECL